MRRRTYSRPIRDRILNRAAKECRLPTSEENKEISKERASMSKAGHGFSVLLDEDALMLHNLALLIDAEDATKREAENLKREKQEAIQEELDAEETIKTRSAARRQKEEIEEDDMRKLRKRRQEFREDLLRSGALIAYLLSP